MKSVFTIVAVMSLTASAFASGLTKDQLRLKVARSTEVQALSEAYKKQGYKCQNTEVVSVRDSQILARKTCFLNEDVGESAKIMEIEAYLFDETSNVLIQKIEFVSAG